MSEKQGWNRSRIMVLVGAGMGILAVFMPWAKLGRLSFSGIDTPDGLIHLFAYGVIVVIGLLGTNARPVGVVAGVFCLLLAAVPGLFTVSKILGDVGRFAAIGLYLTVAASIWIAVFLIKGWTSRSSEEASRGPAPREEQGSAER